MPPRVSVAPPRAPPRRRRAGAGREAADAPHRLLRQRDTETGRGRARLRRRARRPRVAGRFAEIEAEVVTGDGAALTAIGKELRRAGADRSRGVPPKLARALAGEAAPEEARPTRPRPAASARCSPSSTARCSPTIRACGSARIAEALHRAARRDAARARTPPRRGRPRRRRVGRAACAPSSSGSGRCSVRCATSTCCRAHRLGGRAVSSVTTPGPSARSGGGWGRSTPTRGRRCWRRCPSRATSACSTGWSRRRTAPPETRRSR